MYSDEFTAAAGAAKAKSTFLRKNPLGYFIASMQAGVYVGLGILLIFSIGGQLSGLPYAKLIMGTSFGIALSLVIMAGAELFTGNNLIMTAGMFKNTVDIRQTMKLWLVCHAGNWAGSVLVAAIFYGTGLASDSVGAFIAATAEAKMNVPFFPLFFRGVLCNVLVCLATWCNFRCKSESGKLIMIFWCVFAFITSNYEHSVANMTLLTLALFAPFESAVSLSGYFYNIFVVTLGNMSGGILFVSLPYFIMARFSSSHSPT